jgi:hypothetical protein
MQHADGSIEGLYMADKMKSRVLKDRTLQYDKNKRISLH